MPLGEERYLSGYATVVSCTLEDVSDGCVGDIKPKLVAELCKGSTALFPCSSNKVAFVCVSKLGGWPEHCSFSMFLFLWNFLTMSRAVLLERPKRVAALETLSPASTAPTSQFFVAGECW